MLPVWYLDALSISVFIVYIIVYMLPMFQGVAMSGNPTRCQAQLQVQEAPLPLVSLETQANIKKSCTLSQGAHRESPAVLATSFARYM